MYLHLGQDVVVRTEDVLGIFDLDNTSFSKHTRAFLTRAEKAGKVVTVSEDLPKSFVLTTDGDKERVYISQVSAATLQKRHDMTQHRTANRKGIEIG